MQKRGVIVSEPFIYALTVIIVGVILIMGYKSVGSSKKFIDTGELLQFSNKINFDIKSVGREYGRLKKVSYSVPRNMEEVCFVDLGKKDEILASKIVSFYPTVKDSLRSNLDKNVFFIGSVDASSFHVDDMSITHYPFMFCFNQEKNKINIGIEGLGGGKSSVFTEFRTSANISGSYSTALSSADRLIRLIVPKGAQSDVPISVEMSPPTAQLNGGFSDVYRFGPKKVKFDPPIELRIKYHQDIAGKCPYQLPFYQVSEEGSEKIILSESIDCKSNIAVFKVDEFI